MFCPYCGGKDTVESGQCFVCEKRIPNFDNPTAKARAAASSSATSASVPVSASGEPIAALGDRLIAVLLDLVFLCSLVALGALAITRFQLQSRFGSPLLFSVASVSLVVLLVFLYYFLLEALFGATLGKAIAGIQVRPATGGGKIGFRSSLFRNLLRLIDGIGFYFLGYLVALFSKQNRRIGDYVGGTVVVQRNMAWGEKVTVLILWMVGVAGFSWGAYTLCPRCVDLQVARVVEQLGVERSTAPAADSSSVASN